MGTFIKEFTNDSLKETFIFDESGITFKKGDALNIGSNEIVYHAFFPYGSIADIDLPFKGMMELYVYIEKTKKKFSFTLKDLSQNGDLKSAIKFTKKQMKKCSYSPVVIYKEQQGDSANDLEHIMFCEACGQVYRYHDDDIRKNREKIKEAGTSVFGAVTAGMGGNLILSTMNSQDAQNKLNSIIDYTSCPMCHSKKVKRITEEEFKELKGKNDPPETKTSNLDEIKKLKELLDLGAITEEEFNTKKKELLGL